MMKWIRNNFWRLISLHDKNDLPVTWPNNKYQYHTETYGWDSVRSNILDCDRCSEAYATSLERFMDPWRHNIPFNYAVTCMADSPFTITLSIDHVSCIKLVLEIWLLLVPVRDIVDRVSPFACRTGSEPYSEENEFMNHNHNVTRHNCSHDRLGLASPCCYLYPKRMQVIQWYYFFTTPYVCVNLSLCLFKVNHVTIHLAWRY